MRSIEGTAAHVGAFCVVAWLSLVALVPGATACICVQSGSPCADFSQADAVFEAVVDHVVAGPGFIDQVPTSRGVFSVTLPEHVVTFREGESLVGPRVDRVLTPTKEEACGFTFEPGTRYLVVASRRSSDGAFIVTRCSLTRRARPDDPVVRHAMSMRAGVPTGQLWGTVLLGNVQAVAGARIIIKGRQTVRTVTGTDGRYLVTGLPAGRYTMSVRPPRALAAAKATSLSMSIDAQTRCAEINPVLSPRTRITGTITDPEPGSPSAPTVELWRVDREYAAPRLVSSHTADVTGKYRFDDPPPGRYFVGVMVGTRPTPEAPFMESRAQSAARDTLFDIGLREQVVLRPMVLRHAPVIQVAGRVVRRDGTPCAGATVSLAETGTNPHITTALSGPDGSFTARVMGGERYRVSVALPGIGVAATDLEVGDLFVTLTLPR